METDFNIEALKRWLDRGDIDRIANEAGISRRQASNILAGRSRNFAFLRLLIEEAERNMALAKRTQILADNLKLITNAQSKD